MDSTPATMALTRIQHDEEAGNALRSPRTQEERSAKRQSRERVAGLWTKVREWGHAATRGEDDHLDACSEKQYDQADGHHAHALVNGRCWNQPDP
jgi:hypothetical protein